MDKTTGIAVLSSSYRFYIVGNVAEPKSANRFPDVTGEQMNLFKKIWKNDFNLGLQVGILHPPVGLFYVTPESLRFWPFMAQTCFYYHLVNNQYNW